MKTIVAGSRNVNSYTMVADAIKESGLKITEIVSGGCRGVDRFGEEYAFRNNLPLKRFVPDWSALGKKAGPFRNQKMAEYADALIAIWDGKSAGTRDMIRKFSKLNGKIIRVKIIPEALEGKDGHE